MTVKVLVVDDESESRDISKTMLESEGYLVVTAASGKEALEKAGSEGPDLILLDAVMPGVSGFEVCRTLKTQKKTRFIHVVMFTLLDREVDRNMGKEAGADGYLVKSPTSEDLVAEVKKHLQLAYAAKFSRALGLSHTEIQGMKILLEFDPGTSYETCIRDFILEARSHGEATIIFTRKTSAIYRTAKMEEGVVLVPVAEDMTISPILEAHAGDQVALVYDSLTEVALSVGFQDVYRFTKSMLEQLAEHNVTALFLINPGAHSQSETSSFRGLFADQAIFDAEGLRKLRLHL